MKRIIKNKIESSIGFSRIHYLWYSIILLFPGMMVMSPKGDIKIKYRIRCKNRKTFYLLIVLFLVGSLLITSTIAIGLNQKEPVKKSVSIPIIITSFEYTMKKPVSSVTLCNVSLINSTQVYDFYRINFNDTVRKQAQMIGLDEEYYTIDVDQFRSIVNNSFFKDEKYIHNFFDCDDYAFKVIGEFSKGNLSGLAVGLLFWVSPLHAEPFFIDDNGLFWVVLGQDRIERVCNLDRSILNLILI